MTRFGSTARDTRHQLGLTQIELAERVGITQAAYSAIETGRRTTTIKTARAICDALGLSAPWPAVAFLEDYTAKYAREFDLTTQQARVELTGDHDRSIAEFNATGTGEGPWRVLDAAAAKNQ